MHRCFPPAPNVYEVQPKRLGSDPVAGYDDSSQPPFVGPARRIEWHLGWTRSGASNGVKSLRRKGDSSRRRSDRPAVVGVGIM